MVSGVNNAKGLCKEKKFKKSEFTMEVGGGGGGSWSHS